MKKLLAMLCMLTCMTGLSACGQEASKEATDFQNNKAIIAENMAVDMIVPYMVNQYYGPEGSVQAQKVALHQECYNVHELESITEENLNVVLSLFANSTESGSYYGITSVDVEGNGILNGLVSYGSAYASLGEIDSSTRWEADSKVSGDQIIVTVYLTGSEKDEQGNLCKAQAEVIFSNDIFLTVESCAINMEQSMGDLMLKATMDTLMGMATVFIVLILISVLIWLLGFIPKLQGKKSKAKKEVKQNEGKDAVDNTIAQIVEKEENTADDLELVAVIAAAIAASEGAASTDGFVVRSIRKRR